MGSTALAMSHPASYPINALLDAKMRTEQALCSFKNLPAQNCQRKCNSMATAWRCHGTGGLLQSHPSPYEAPIEPHERHSIADMVRQR